MMHHADKITLFVPEKLSSEGSTWRRYVISHVHMRLRGDKHRREGTVYIFDSCACAYDAAVRCVMPRIFPGCAVLPCADMTDESAVCALPEGCLRVLESERYSADRASHIKLTLG